MRCRACTRLGRPAACRAGHTKGTFCAGTFTPYREAAELTEAAHLQDAPVPVTVRFSRVTGNPDKHDGKDGMCGMATRFHLPDGSDTDLIGVSIGRFTNRARGLRRDEPDVFHVQGRRDKSVRWGSPCSGYATPSPCCRCWRPCG